MRLKEVKISIHRKYTENFQSYGYRIGIMLDVDKVDNARTCYYSGKAFLNERIAEEDLIIKNLMAKKVAEKKLGFKELVSIPEKKVGKIDHVCDECGKSFSDYKSNSEHYADDNGLMLCSGCGKKLGAGASESGKKDDGEVVMIPFDVKQIKRTSAKAVLVELFGTKGDLWIPKSCVGDGDAMDLMQKGVKSQLFVASWFLIKSGLM